MHIYKIYYSRKVFALLNDHPSYLTISINRVFGNTVTETFLKCLKEPGKLESSSVAAIEKIAFVSVLFF